MHARLDGRVDVLCHAVLLVGGLAASLIVERAWRWYSIPARGEKGSETWIGNAIDHGCGATWLSGSYDAAFAHNCSAAFQVL